MKIILVLTMVFGATQLMAFSGVKQLLKATEEFKAYECEYNNVDVNERTMGRTIELLELNKKRIEALNALLLHVSSQQATKIKEISKLALELGDVVCEYENADVNDRTMGRTNDIYDRKAEIDSLVSEL